MSDPRPSSWWTRHVTGRPRSRILDHGDAIPLGSLVALVAGLAVIAVFVSTRGGDKVQVQTAEVTSGPIVRRALVTGTLEPARMVEVGSQVSGTIASIEVDFNDTVKAGQILARLDPASFQTRLTEAEAGLAKARAERAATAGGSRRCATEAGERADARR